MPALPENASLEQRNLGFAHTSPIVAPLTSPFGWREHPVSGGTRFHYGVDLGAATGTDICAFADGTVYATGDSSSLGYYIMIQHEDGYMTLYAHCSKITVTSGAVTMGQKIAEVGETGIAVSYTHLIDQQDRRTGPTGAGPPVLLFISQAAVCSGSAACVGHPQRP